MTEQPPTSLITINVQVDGKTLVQAMEDHPVHLRDLLGTRRHDEVMLKDLRPGAVFVTRDGIYAVKSEYLYPSGVCQCVLLESGEYAHFEDGNKTLVREVRIA